MLLAERLQKDKEELMARLELAQAEKAALEAKLDPQAVDEQVCSCERGCASVIGTVLQCRNALCVA